MILNYVELNLKYNLAVNGANEKQQKRLTRIITKLSEWTMESARKYNFK
jgi:hypothetical protein